MLGVSRYLVPLLLAVCLGGCASIRPAAGPDVQPDISSTDGLPEGEGWWFARFYIDRPEGEAPRWHIGTLLAGEVIAPVFDRRYGDILIWRIHRRAGNDENGHMLSFVFYATAPGARRIYSDIADNAMLSQLRREGVVTRVVIDDVRHIQRPGIDDTSDESWLPVVRKTWPALIMGASRMWLDMVTELAAAQPQDLELEHRYLAVDEEINRIWAEQGQHAILHHLSAIYAYKPLLITY